MAEHSNHLLVIIISWFIFILTLVFNGLATTGRDGIFLNSTGAISDEFPTETTPASWTFTIWWIIYLFQGAWMIYLLTTLFRQNPDGEYIYIEPGVIPWDVHVFYIVANMLNMVWLLLWDHRLMTASFLILSAIPFCLFIATLLAVRSLKHKTKEMMDQNLYADIWMNRIFVHNGLAIYATWTAIATLVNLTIVLAYRSPIHATLENASTAALAILTFELVFWTVLDLSLFDEYTRYLLTPYLVVLWAVIGIVDTDHQHQSRNRVFSILLLITAIICLALKIAMMILRSRKTTSDEALPLTSRKASTSDH